MKTLSAIFETGDLTEAAHQPAAPNPASSYRISSALSSLKAALSAPSSSKPAAYLASTPDQAKALRLARASAAANLAEKADTLAVRQGCPSAVPSTFLAWQGTLEGSHLKNPENAGDDHTLGESEADGSLVNPGLKAFEGRLSYPQVHPRLMVPSIQLLGHGCPGGRGLLRRSATAISPFSNPNAIMTQQILAVSACQVP